MKRISKVLLLALMVCTLFAGCSIETIQSKKEDSKYNFYYLNTNETALKSEPYEPKEETKEYMVKALLQKLGNGEVPENGISLLPENVSVSSYDLQDNLLIIDFSKEYSEMSKVREVLTRDGIVQTFLQIPDIAKIRFTVAGQPLKDSRNQEIGDMTDSTFVEVSKKNEDNYRYDTFTLYFADKSGKRLLKETRNVYYRRTLPKERVVLEQLAKGPLEDGHYATIPENTMAINVITADRICYLDLNSEFQDAALDVAENISVYSVVNSIVDSCEADKVQISIEGNSGGNFQKNLPLYKFYEKNKDLVIPDEDEES